MAIIRVKPSAESDILFAFTFYENQKTGLGSQYILEIDKVFNRISKFPKIGKVVYKDFHQILILKFPFRIFYKVHNSEIHIYAVIHQSREFQKLLRKKIQ